MSNPYGYDEKYMHSQLQPEWANNPLGPSTIGKKGCFMSDLTYIRSILEDKNYEIPDQVKAVGNAGGYTYNGDTKWDVVRRVMHLVISATRPTGRYVSMRNVWVRGSNNAIFSHWVVELTTKLMYDPLRAGGNFVHAMSFYPPIFIKPGVINRRYVKRG